MMYFITINKDNRVEEKNNLQCFLYRMENIEKANLVSLI